MIDGREDIPSTGEATGGKCYYRCDLRKRFNCTFMLRAYLCPIKGIGLVEESEENSHGEETHKAGLPNAIKEEIRTIL